MTLSSSVPVMPASSSSRRRNAGRENGRIYHESGCHWQHALQPQHWRNGKRHAVRELDALGGVMGLAADATYLQSRMLNKGKGPAVHALRVQTDRKRYHEYMKHALELTPGLAIHQAEVVSIETENGRVKGVVTQLNGEYSAKCVVIATGTNLGGKILWAMRGTPPARTGMHAATP